MPGLREMFRSSRFKITEILINEGFHFLNNKNSLIEHYFEYHMVINGEEVSGDDEASVSTSQQGTTKKATTITGLSVIPLKMGVAETLQICKQPILA